MTQGIGLVPERLAADVMTDSDDKVGLTVVVTTVGVVLTVNIASENEQAADAATDTDPMVDDVGLGEDGVTSDDKVGPTAVVTTDVISLTADVTLGNKPTTDVSLDTEGFTTDEATEDMQLAATVRTDDGKLITGISTDNVGLGEDEINNDVHTADADEKTLKAGLAADVTTNIGLGEDEIYDDVHTVDADEITVKAGLAADVTSDIELGGDEINDDEVHTADVGVGLPGGAGLAVEVTGFLCEEHIGGSTADVTTDVIVLAADLTLGDEATTDIPLDTEGLTADVATGGVRLAATVRSDDVKLTTGILTDSAGLGEDEINDDEVRTTDVRVGLPGGVGLAVEVTGLSKEHFGGAHELGRLEVTK